MQQPRSDEEPLSKVLSSIDEVVYQLSFEDDPLAGKVTFVSPRVRDILGFEPQEFLEDRGLWFRMLHPDDAASIRQDAQRLDQRSLPWTRQYRLRHKLTGEYRWMEDRAVLQRDAQGRPIGQLGAARDITDRKRAEEALLAANTLLEKTFASLSEAVFVVNPLNRTIVTCNTVAERIFGYTKDELVGRNTEFLHVNREMYEEFGSKLFAALDKDHVFTTKFRMKRKDGSILVTEHTVTEMLDASGHRTGVVSVMRDITARDHAAKALRETEQRYRLLLQQSLEAIYLCDVETKRILEANPAFLDLLGYTAEEVRALTLYDVVAHDRQDIDAHLHQVLTSGAMTIGPRRWRRKDGSLVDVDVTGSMIAPGGGEILFIVARDITERKRAEEELARSRRQLRELVRRTRSAREAERRRIARQIHDGLGHALTALKMDLAWLRGRLPMPPNPLADKTQAMLRQLDETIEQSRTLAADLRPAVLDELGLLAAFEWATEEFTSRTGIRCTLDAPDGTLSLDSDRSTDVFRILQEALTNVTRHARARAG